jgi:hypothetical protein
MASFNSNFYFPQEGLNYLLNAIPRGTQAVPSTLYLGLSATTWSTISGYAAAGSVPITLNGGTYPVLEASGLPGYNRLTLSGAGWQAPATNTITIGTSTGVPVQYCTYSGNSALTFTNTGNTYSTINGIFLTITGTVGSSSAGGSTVLWYAPFSDLSTVTLASGDSLTVTPTWQSASYPY